MILLCAFHHLRIHEGGWVLGLTEAGEVVVVPPQLRQAARAPAA